MIKNLSQQQEKGSESQNLEKVGVVLKNTFKASRKSHSQSITAPAISYQVQIGRTVEIVQ